MRIDKERIWIRFPTERLVVMQGMADKLGMPVSQFVALAAWSGSTFIMRALDPDFKSVVKAAEEAEVEAMYEDFQESVAVDYGEFLEWKRQKEAAAHGLP